jgi:4a-hydroxytetrahydrobiopterin dehydratase
MPEQNLLSDGVDIQKRLPQWHVSPDLKAISREFVFKDFKAAFEFMTLSAGFAEKIDHHPDWSNAWNKVNVSLSTHSLHGITELDLAMANAMDGFAHQV